MKRIIFALMTAIMLCTLAQGKNRTVTENDSLGNPKRVIELKDTMINGKSVTDTLPIVIPKAIMIIKAAMTLMTSAGISDITPGKQSSPS